MAVTVSPEAHAHTFDALVAATLPAAARRIDAFAARVRSAHLEPEDLVDVAALERIPVLSKDELIELQAASPPFGGLLAPGARARRVFQSPGPLYEPELEHRDPWRAAPALEAAGFGSDDLVLNAFSYHLSPAGAMFEAAALALGGSVVPGGVGNLELQARACLDLGVTAYVGLPSYLKSLIERAQAMGAEPGTWPVSKALVSGEPLPASLRARLEEWTPTVRQLYGTAEAGLIGYECDAVEGLHVPSDALVEVCDLTTGKSMWDGGEGQVVVTLFSSDYALVRFGTGDLSAFMTEPCPCGAPSPRLAGWLGRVGEAVKVRGMFLHPRQAEDTIGGTPGLARFQLQIDRIDHRDVLRCELVAEDPSAAGGLAELVRTRIRSALRFDADVALVDGLPGDAPVLLDRRTWD
ncbi:MAG: phenylacetate--CoA ligase family protein [Actinobacteria bacterium]|nr:phenylacetate--CoA ligase family protein [Actinomycetota bacterium]